jgi:hypothetical protein
MKATRIVVAAAIAALQSMPGWAQDAASKQALARMANNPYAGVISVPLLYDLNFGGGLGSKTQQVLNAQPVIPFGLNSDWMLVTRTIVPLIAQPALEGSSGAHGLGDIQFSAFLSPARVGRLDWGVGPVFQLRSASNTVLGQGKWGAGPTAGAIWSGDDWTVGAIVNNIWSYAGDRDRPDVNQMQLQPMVTYFFPNSPHRFLSSSPTITANWKASGSERWTVPLSLGIGELVKFGNQPVNLQATAFYNAIKPDGAATWTLEIQVQFVFAE